jgi:hypothetical protein
MERKPGERMIGQLEGRSEEISGEFKAQEVANTLWAYATTMGDGGDIRGVQLAGCCKHTMDGWRRYQGSSAAACCNTGSRILKESDSASSWYEPREWLNKQYER